MPSDMPISILLKGMEVSWLDFNSQTQSHCIEWLAIPQQVTIDGSSEMGEMVAMQTGLKYAGPFCFST